MIELPIAKVAGGIHGGGVVDPDVIAKRGGNKQRHERNKPERVGSPAAETLDMLRHGHRRDGDKRSYDIDKHGDLPQRKPDARTGTSWAKQNPVGRTNGVIKFWLLE